MKDTCLQNEAAQVHTRKESQYDYLRVIAAIAVVVIHVCAMDWRRIDVNSSQWLTIHIYDMICKFSVPVFFMVSGRFFLDPQREMSTGKLLGKIARLAAAFLFWSAVYTILNVLRVVQAGQDLKANLSWIFVEFFGGEYHMWFLYAIGALYLITPVLRLIVRDRKITEYFLLLFFAFGILLDTLCALPKVGVILTTIAEKAVFHFALGFSGYFVLGYYLHQYPPTVKLRRICYCLGLAGTLFSIIATWLVSVKQGVANEELAGNLSPNVAAAAVAVYLFAADRLSGRQPGKVISLLSRYSFGIYLAHPLVLWVFDWIGLTPAKFAPVIMVPVITVLAIALSVLVTKVCKAIPFVGKSIT